MNKKKDQKYLLANSIVSEMYVVRAECEYNPNNMKPKEFKEHRLESLRLVKRMLTQLEQSIREE